MDPAVPLTLNFTPDPRAPCIIFPFDLFSGPCRDEWQAQVLGENIPGTNRFHNRTRPQMLCPQNWNMLRCRPHPREEKFGLMNKGPLDLTHIPLH